MYDIKIIGSSGQTESYKCDDNNKSMKTHGGMQCITTRDRIYIPLCIISGLIYISMKPYTDHEWKVLSGM